MRVWHLSIVCSLMLIFSVQAEAQDSTAPKTPKKTTQAKKVPGSQSFNRHC
jgi:hypothetical protein